MPLLENLISPATVERLGWTLVHCLWQATAVALLLAGTLRLLRRADASLRYVVSCLALILMVALPVLTIRFISGAGSAAEPDPVPAGPPSATSSLLSTAQVVSRMPPLTDYPSSLEIAASTPPASWRERIAAALEPVLPYVVFGWLLGVLGLSAWHLGGWAQLQRIKRRMVQQVGEPLREKVEDLGNRLGVHRGVALLESALVEVPTVIGWLRPAILLPASALTGLSPDQLEAILAHELAHIRRYDYLVNVLQTVVEILGFYHPAVWWVSRRIRIERENCCDDLAVRACGDSLQYARALTCLEETRHGRTEWAVAATGGSLFARIARVLGRPVVDDRRFAWLPGLLTLALITALLIPTAFVLGAAGPQRPEDTSKPAVVADANNRSNPPEEQQSNNTEIRVQTDASDSPSGAEKASVLLEFTVAKVSRDGAMDRETVLEVLKILGETARDAAPDAARPPTAHEILKKYVAGRDLPPATVQSLTDLLRSRGYIQIESNPRVRMADGTSASVRIGEQVPVPVPAQNGDTSPTTMAYVECGTAIQATAHVRDPNILTLEMAVELTHVLANPQPDQTPRVRRRAIESTVTVPTERYFSLLMEPQQDEADEVQAEEPVLILVKPSIVASQAAHTTEEDRRPRSPIVPADMGRRQVLLDARIVTLERGDLLDLGVEWSMPTRRAGSYDDGPNKGDVPSDFLTGMRLGCTLDRMSTNSLLAKLDLLQKNGRVDVLSSPRILVQDGRQTQLKVVTEEWFMRTPSTTGEVSPSVGQLERVETGTILTATPYIGDHNDLTLRMAVEVSDSVPNAGGSGLPVVTRRVAQNAVTIKEGGTVILAGLMEDRTRSKGSPTSGGSNLPLLGVLFKKQSKDKAAREVVFFVTARLADNRQATNSPASEPAETVIHIPPAADDSAEAPGAAVESAPTPSREAEQQTEPGIAVEARIVASGTRFWKDLQGGRPIKGVTSSQEVKTLHEMGRLFAASKPLLLDDERADLLLKAVQKYPDGHVLAAPKVQVRDGEPACIWTGEQIPYIAGYEEPNVPGGEPKATHRTLDAGLKFEVTARLIGRDGVALDGALRRTTLLGLDKRKYQGRYPYQLPRTDDVTIPLRHLVVPCGQTAVILGKARRKASAKPDAALLLVKLSIVSPPTTGEEQGEEEPMTPGAVNLIDVLGMLMQRTGAKIAVDATVKPIPIAIDFDPTNVAVPEALQRILQGTGYQFDAVKDGAQEGNAYAVYKPLTITFEGADLRAALADLSVSAGVVIVTDANVTGKVHADIREQPLAKALEILLAGTPYVIKRTPNYYLVADRAKRSPDDPDQR